MCLFKYREKRYGKFAFMLTAVLFVAIAAASIFGGVYAVLKMSHWVKYVLVVLGAIVGLAAGVTGIFMLAMSPSLINKTKSVKDGNRMKGISGMRLCDKCGRVISKQAHFCEHCGENQETGLGLKECPKCKTKNSGTAQFCEKCGTKFE